MPDVRPGPATGRVNGEANHLHLLVNFPPAAAISRPVSSLKRRALPRLRQERPDLTPALPAGKPPVAPGPASPAPQAAPISVPRQHTEQQNRPA